MYRSYWKQKVIFLYHIRTLNLLVIRRNVFILIFFSWVEWHHRFQKLHQQAVLEAASCSEELTKDALISHGKVWHRTYNFFKFVLCCNINYWPSSLLFQGSLLVHEAICISIWRQKIFPKILELDPDMSHTFLLYAVVRYQATILVISYW